MKRNWVLAMLVIEVFIMPLSLNAQTDIWVTNNSDSGFGSLRWAIAEANNGEDVQVVKFNITTGDKTINLNNPIWITNSNITVDGSTQFGQNHIKINLSQIQTNGDWAFVANANDVEIKNLWFSNLITLNSVALGAWNASNVKISNNYFTNCRVSLGAGGASNQITFDSNNVGFTPFSQFEGINELGLWASNSSNLLLENNTITNVFDSPIVIAGCVDVNILNNFIGTEIDGSFGNGNINSDTTGVWIGGSSGILLQDNKISASTNSGWGFSAINSSNISIDRDNEISGCNVGIALNNVNGFTILKSSLVCNLIPTYFQNQTNITQPPLIQNANLTMVSGESQPNAKIEVYESNIWECFCQGETFLGTTQSNSSGEWKLNIELEGIDKIVALSTLNNLTSEYSECISVEYNSICPKPTITDYNVGRFGAMINWEVENYSYDDMNFQDSYSFEWRKKGTSLWKVVYSVWGTQDYAYGEEMSILIDDCYFGDCLVIFDFPPPPTSFYLNGLQPNTEYEIRVRLNCPNNKHSEYSDVLYIETVNPIPDDYSNETFYSASRGFFNTACESLTINDILVRAEDCEKDECDGCITGFSSLNSGHTDLYDKVFLRSGNNDLVLKILPDTFVYELQNNIEIDTLDLKLFCSIWIDYNQNLIFDDFEKVYASSKFNPLQDLTVSFLVNSFEGKRKMRLIYQNGISPNAYGYYCTGHTYDMDLELTDVFCSNTDIDILCQDWINSVYDSIQSENIGQCIDIVLYEDICQIEFLINGEVCGQSSYYINGDPTGYCNTSGNYSIIHSCNTNFPICSNCELFPSFTITDLNYPPDNFLDRKYQVSNTSLPPYDSLAWWSSSLDWFGWNENSPNISIIPSAIDRKEEICLQLLKNENGIWCDSMICKMITVPCTNYAFMQIDIEGNEVYVNTSCDCNTSSVLIDYGDGINSESFDDAFNTGYNYYDESGTYDLCLYMYNEYCSDTLCQEVVIVSQDSEYNLSANKSCVEKDEQIVFEYKANPLGQNTQIHMGDGFVYDIYNINGTLSHFYEHSGVYNVQLIVDGETKVSTSIQAKSCGWYGFVYSNNGYREDNEELCDFIVSDGRAYISPELSAESYYWTAYRNIQEFNVCGDEAILEVRVKVPQSEGGNSCYDPDIHIYGSKGNAQAHFMQSGCQYYAYIRAG